MRVKDVVVGAEVVFRTPKKSFVVGNAPKGKIEAVGRYIGSYTGPCLTIDAIKVDDSIVPRDRIVVRYDKSRWDYKQNPRVQITESVLQVVEGGALMLKAEYDVMMLGVREAEDMRIIRLQKIAEAAKELDKVMDEVVRAKFNLPDVPSTEVTRTTRWRNHGDKNITVVQIRLDIEELKKVLQHKHFVRLEKAYAKLAEIQAMYPEPKC